ncbi:DNA primase [Sulfurimonas sp. HSL-1716]|uniref:DNA primase n=1 Tax=Hydrocurvibacter sulfurireducens TaxID=3131937 RepID=UPI0031F76DE0
MISNDSIEQLKARLDILDVVGSYIELKKNGANFKAPCPFHDEKSPSFVVSPSKQIYHCFGCGAGGDSIRFVMEYEKLSYPEAIEKLAGQYNFSLRYTDNKNQQKRSPLLDRLNEYYQTLLTHNKEALSYLKDRGIFESSIEKFGIGYAPGSVQTISYIQKNMFTMNEAIEVGVAGHDNGKSFARFIERITFPIQATNGTIVGFGGRTISGHQAKYVNSPQTKLFNKSRLLYAYNFAKESIHKKQQIIITEGYLDVIMLHQTGFTNAVATLGTALTPEHLPLLRKGEPKVVMAYDGDSAGAAAALKAAKLLSTSGFSGGVVLFSGGMDPADMVKNGQIEELNNLFRRPKPFIDFVVDHIIESYDIRDPKAKHSALEEAVGYLKTLPALLQEEYRGKVAQKLGISSSVVNVNTHNLVYSNKKDVRTPQKDMWELSLIKTVLEYPELTDQILDAIDPSILQFHQREFRLAISGQTEAPELMAISVDESIISHKSYDELKAELINFLIKHYNQEYKKIQLKSDMAFEQKAFLIRSIRGKITKLQRGELVAYEG